MKRRISYLVFAMATGIILAGCGGGDGGGSSGSSGTVSMNITDAKPNLPDGVEQVLIEIEEVSAHKSGGGWTSFALPQKPFIVDLLQFNEGKTTQLVPPASISSGKYTQVRIVVKEAWIVINGDKKPLIIPSENLKTDKNFDFIVEGGGAVDLTVDFDLSQSIVVIDPDTYQLKPVLHLVTTTEAWTIKGKINSSSIGDPPKKAVVVVTWDKDDSGDISDGDELYTTLSVTKAEGTPPPEFTEFKVFWLVPGMSYYVEVYLGDPTTENPPKYKEGIKKDAIEWKTSIIFSLNGGTVLF